MQQPYRTRTNLSLPPQHQLQPHPSQPSARDEVVRSEISAYAPFMPDGDQTSPNSRGLSQVVYHQVQCLLFSKCIYPCELSKMLLRYMRSSDACVVVLALKDYEERHNRGYRIGTLQYELSVSIECFRVRTLRGRWNGLVPGKSFGFIDADSGQRIWCHANEVKDNDIKEGINVSFELVERRGKQQASNVQAFQSQPRITNQDRHQRTALYSTRGADWTAQDRPIAPKLMMMSHEEATVMLEMGCCVQDDIPNGPYLDKIYVLDCCHQALPSKDALFSTQRFEIAEAQQCLQHLSAIKSKLDKKDIQVWNSHKKKTLLNQQVRLAVRDRIQPEMCTIAFLKMIEMLAAYNLVVPAKDVTKFNSLHLCEAPGAFICATNHYIQSSVKKRFPQLTWDWVACTLNPYHEGNNPDAMVQDDALINETPDQWFFGSDNSGDICLSHNIAATWERVAQIGPVLLVTADGSIDCSGNPNDQEEVVAQLHYCEAVAAVGALAVGGAFVLKMFTLFEHSSIGLVYLLSRLFEYISICKPTLSTPGNSEIYIVCKGFKGIDEQYKLALLRFTGKEWRKSHDNVPLALVPEKCISKIFMRSILRGAEYFARLQSAVISRNLHLFHDFPQYEGHIIQQARQIFVHEWMRRYQIGLINRHERIVPHKNLTGAAQSNRVGGQQGPGKRSYHGNLEERQAKKAKNNEIRDGRCVGTELEVAPKNYGMHVSDFSKKMMAIMGHKDGEGLGKDSSGINVHIDPTSRSQGARTGLGFGESSMEPYKHKLQLFDPAEIIWLGMDVLKHAATGQMFDGVCRQSWIVTGAKIQEIKMSKFCQNQVILSLLEVRTGEDKTDVARQHFGCYGVDQVGFVSRSALKLADLQSIISLALEDKMPDLKGLFNGEGHDLSFIDLYGGSGGFSDFMLFKHGSSIHRWWMINRQDKKRPNLAGFKAFHSKDRAVPSYNPADADVVDAGNLEAMAAFIDTTGARTNPVAVVFGDGTVNCSGNPGPEQKPRTIELLSMPTLWCQVWAVLGILRVGGSFICKVTDSFGRCTIGSYYLLCHCFQYVTIIKPSMSGPSNCERFLVALDFLGHDHSTVKSVRTHFAHAMRVSTSMSESEDVLQILPPNMILTEPFLSHITKLNEKYAQSEIAAIEYLKTSAGKAHSEPQRVDSLSELSRIGLPGPH